MPPFPMGTALPWLWLLPQVPMVPQALHLPVPAVFTKAPGVLSPSLGTLIFKP